MVSTATKIEIRALRAAYGNRVVLEDVSLDVHEGEILAVIGPAGAGKTSLLNCINRMSDMIPGMKVEGSIRVDGREVRDFRDPSELRRRIGVVFPLPVGLPMSICDNVAFAPRMGCMGDKKKLSELVDRCPREAALFDDGKARVGDL